MKESLRRLLALEARHRLPPPPVPVLMPGEEPPAGYTGRLVRVQIVDSRKPDGTGPLMKCQ